MGGACGLLIYLFGSGLAAVLLPQLAPVKEMPGVFFAALRGITYWEVVAVCAAAVVGAVLARAKWRLVGVLGYVALLLLIAGYLIYSLTVSIPRVPPGDRWISYLLFVAEAGSLSLVFLYSFYSMDAAARRRWARVAGGRGWSPRYLPQVAFEVPVYNEPPAMVEETVARLMRQDYPADRFCVVVVDDSSDAAARAALAAFCEKVGARYVTRPVRTGYKAGALNHATGLLAPGIAFIAVVDADYWVEPDYLRSVVGYFVDPALSFVQTPQDYRNPDESFLTRQYQAAEAFFYHAVMPSRNEANAIIFCGTMGILRRAALEQVGGFAEDQICEDAEVSVRLAMNGWDSLYLDHAYARGLMPAVFESYKKQFHRWAFGNVRILFTHGGRILRSRMSWRQKFDFIASSLHWFDGLFVTAIAFTLLYMGLGPLVGYDAVTHHQRELSLLGLVPIFLVVDSTVRLHLALRLHTGKAGFGKTLLIQGMWFAMKFTNMTAAIKSASGVKEPFLRTPKEPGARLGRSRAFARALRLTKAESCIGFVLVAVSVVDLVQAYPKDLGRWQILLSGWLALYGVFFLCAPAYAYCSYRTLAGAGTAEVGRLRMAAAPAVPNPPS